MDHDSGKENHTAEHVNEHIAVSRFSGLRRFAAENAKNGTQREHFPEKEQSDEITRHNDAHRAAGVEQSGGKVESTIVVDDIENSDERQDCENIQIDQTPSVGPTKNEFEIHERDRPVKPLGDLRVVDQSDYRNDESNNLAQPRGEKGDHEGS